MYRISRSRSANAGPPSGAHGDREPGPGGQRREPAEREPSGRRAGERPLGDDRGDGQQQARQDRHTDPRDGEVAPAAERQQRGQREQRGGGESSHAGAQPIRATGPYPRPAIVLRGRTLPAALAALALVLALVQRPGRASSDTKIDLHVDPGGFLADVASAWSSTGDLGHVQGGQYGGYLFPMGPFFALGHALGGAPWLVQRLWLALVLALAAWGAVRLMDELAGPRGLPHAVAGLLFLLNPYVVVFTRPHDDHAARLRGAAVAARLRAPRGARGAVVVVAGGVRADRDRVRRRRERGGDGVGAARAGAARALRAVHRRDDVARHLGLRVADRHRDRGCVRVVGRAAARPVALRRRLPALHRAAGDDLEHDQPARVAAADGLLDLVPRRRLRRRAAAVLRGRRRAAVRAAGRDRGAAGARAGADGLRLDPHAPLRERSRWRS